MSALTILGASAGADFNVWADLFEVILWGVGAGVGLTIAFSLAMRGLILGEIAKREGRGGAAALHLTKFVVFSVVCVAAVGFALASMLHR